LRTTRTNGRQWARPALAVFGTAALALAALALRAAPDHPAWRAGGVLGERTGPTALLALGLAGGGAVLAARHRARRRDATDQPPLTERLLTAVGVLLPLFAVAVPLVLLMLPDRPGSPGDPQPTPPAATPTPGAETGGYPPPVDDHPLPASGSEYHSPGPLLGYLALALLAAAALGAAVVLWRRFGHLLRRGTPPPPVTLTLDEDDPGQALAEAVGSGRRALHGTDVRAAVIACYAAMETSLARSGVPGRASDSPSDLLARAAADGLLTGEPPQTLAALFREARYSSHPMDAGHLDRARAALDAIAAQLATGAAR
jgi:Domain of unknown function (DUF4129)